MTLYAIVEWFLVALCYYMLGDYKAAGAYIDKARLTANPILPPHRRYLRAARCRDDGRKRSAPSSPPRHLTSLTDLPKVIRMRGVGPDDQKHLLEGLAKAGIVPAV